MNEKRIALGVTTWFLGIIVIVIHHVGLHAALFNDSTGNVGTRVIAVFSALPGIDSIYLALMGVVGGILIVSGLLAIEQKER